MAQHRYLIVLPTYDERENLPRMVDAVAAVRDRMPFDGDVLVVDDNSPDGTGQLADRLGRSHEWLHVLHREAKQGLGPAYLAGFEWALARPYSHVLEMDCDLSHPPQALPAMLVASADADLVLGSRYVLGGGIENWGVLRRLISRGGCLYARWILRVGVHDLTGGFKCIRREVLEAVDLTSVRAEGYVFQIEVTYRAILAGFRVKEVPIVFRDRSVGTSKMSARIAVEAMWLVPKLRRNAPAALAAARAAADAPTSRQAPRDAVR